MIEMDQFAHTLSGKDTEIIERLSKQSVATMKDIGGTIKRYTALTLVIIFSL